MHRSVHLSEESLTLECLIRVSRGDIEEVVLPVLIPALDTQLGHQHPGAVAGEPEELVSKCAVRRERTRGCVRQVHLPVVEVPGNSRTVGLQDLVDERLNVLRVRRMESGRLLQLAPRRREGLRLTRIEEDAIEQRARYGRAVWNVSKLEPR